MAASYQIKLDPDETDLDRAIDRSYDKLDRLADKASNIDIGGKAGGGGGVGGSRGGLVSDPWSRHEDAQTDLEFAKHLGLSGSEMRGFEYRAAMTERSANRAERLMAGGTAMRHLPGDSGVFSRLATWLGLGSEALIAGMAGGAIITGMEMGSRSRFDLGSAYHIGGGTSAETASVSSFGRFFGRSASESAGAALQLGDALNNGTYGAAYLRSRGIVDLGGLTVDKDTNYLSSIKAIINEPNRATATRVARDVGLTDALWMRDASTSQKDMLLGGMEDAQSPRERRQEVHWRTMKAEAGSWWDNAVRNFSNGVMQGFGIRPYSQQEDDMLNSLPGITGTAHAVEAGAMRFLGMGAGADALTRDLVEGSGYDDQLDPGNANPTYVRTTPGMTGGGPRASGALPVKVRHNQLSQNLAQYSSYLGGYPG